jgi:hypothetical protein
MDSSFSSIAAVCQVSPEEGGGTVCWRALRRLSATKRRESIFSKTTSQKPEPPPPPLTLREGDVNGDGGVVGCEAKALGAFEAEVTRAERREGQVGVERAVEGGGGGVKLAGGWLT